MAAETRNGAKAKEKICECRSQPNEDQQRHDASDVHSNGNSESRGEIKQNTGRDFDVIHQVKALCGFEHATQSIIAKHNGHGGTENIEGDASLPPQLSEHLVDMRHPNSTEYSS